MLSALSPAPVSRGDFPRPVLRPVLQLRVKDSATTAGRACRPPTAPSSACAPTSTSDTSASWTSVSSAGRASVSRPPRAKSPAGRRQLPTSTEPSWRAMLCVSFIPALCACSCPNGQIQPSCYTCLNYCSRGQCSVDSRTLLPQCK